MLVGRDKQRAVVGEGYSYPGGVFPREPFEGLYERADL